MTLTDQLTGESFDVTARAVVNATGVWAGEVDPSIRLRPSRGTHLVFDAATFGNPDCGTDDSDPRRDSTGSSSRCPNSWAGCIWG